MRSSFSQTFARSKVVYSDISIRKRGCPRPFSLSGVYQPKDGQFAEAEVITSPVEAPRELRQREAEQALDWFKTITVDTFG